MSLLPVKSHQLPLFPLHKWTFHPSKATLNFRLQRVLRSSMASSCHILLPAYQKFVVIFLINLANVAVLKFSFHLTFVLRESRVAASGLRFAHAIFDDSKMRRFSLFGMRPCRSVCCARKTSFHLPIMRLLPSILFKSSFLSLPLKFLAFGFFYKTYFVQRFWIRTVVTFERERSSIKTLNWTSLKDIK